MCNEFGAYKYLIALNQNYYKRYYLYYYYVEVLYCFIAVVIWLYLTICLFLALTDNLYIQSIAMRDDAGYYHFYTFIPLCLFTEAFNKKIYCKDNGHELPYNELISLFHICG
jgi:hypothetical protein